MNKFIRNIDKVYSIILSILTIAMDKHWILFIDYSQGTAPLIA